MGFSHQIYTIFGTLLEVPKERSEELLERWHDAKLTFPWKGVGAVGTMGILAGFDGCFYVAGKCLFVHDPEEPKGTGLYTLPDIFGNAFWDHAERYRETEEWLKISGLSEYAKEAQLLYRTVVHYH